MDAEVRLEFANLNKKIDDFIVAQAKLCGDRGVQIGKLEQKNENGEKHEELTLKKKDLRFSYDRLVVTIVVGGFGIFEILKHAGILK